MALEKIARQIVTTIAENPGNALGIGAVVLGFSGGQIIDRINPLAPRETQTAGLVITENTDETSPVWAPTLYEAVNGPLAGPALPPTTENIHFQEDEPDWEAPMCKYDFLLKYFDFLLKVYPNSYTAGNITGIIQNMMQGQTDGRTFGMDAFHAFKTHMGAGDLSDDDFVARFFSPGRATKTGFPTARHWYIEVNADDYPDNCPPPPPGAWTTQEYLEEWIAVGERPPSGFLGYVLPETSVINGGYYNPQTEASDPQDIKLPESSGGTIDVSLPQVDPNTVLLAAAVGTGLLLGAAALRRKSE